MKKLLITGAWKYTREQYEILQKSGYDIIFVQDERGEMPKEAYDAEVVICNGLFLYHNIEMFGKLKVIQLTSAGYDRVPMEYIKEHKIQIHNARGVYSIPMAEFALCGVLNYYKKSRVFFDNEKKNLWEKNREILEIYGKTVLIIGAGNVGTECAKRFKAFGTRVRGIDVYPREDINYDSISALSELEYELSSADIIVLTLPLSEETKGLLGENAFNAMKTGALLVNIARGAVVNTGAMIAALKSGKLGGAILDVFEEEPLNANSILWSMDNVIITPHNSFVGENNENRLFDVINHNLKEV